MSIVSLFIIGCGTYEEGDDIAANSFKKMTVQEKTMYDAVEKEWYQGKMESIRSAVGKRDIAPRENSVPFIDIANVIKTNNDITLQLESGWNTDHKNRAINCRWDRLDEDWYRKLLLTIGVKDYDLQELIPTEEEVIEDKPLTQKEKDLEYIRNGLKEINVLVDKRQETIIKNLSIFISIEELDELFYKIRGCNEALEYYNKALEQRLISYEDQKILIQLATKCKAIQIGEKLTEWKN